MGDSLKVWLLLESGAGHTKADPYDRRAVNHAAIGGHKDILALLAECGASLTHRDAMGRTALVHALCHGTEYGYNDRYSRPKSEKTDLAVPVIRLLVEKTIYGLVEPVDVVSHRMASQYFSVNDRPHMAGELAWNTAFRGGVPLMISHILIRHGLIQLPPFRGFERLTPAESPIG